MKFGKWYVPMVIGIIAGMVAGNIVIQPDGPAPTMSSSQIASAQNKAFVPPGQHDEYYMFSSGGHSGQMFVIGVPSLRRIRTIPVFSPDSATGYGYDERTKELMGGFSWGDAHHPSLSETNG
ncbi:nitrous-oxide reductase, partial [Schinkia azotoformans]